MKPIQRLIVILAAAAAAACLGPAPARAAEPAGPDIRPLLSRMESMGHGYQTEQEWADLFQQINALTAEAEQAGAWPAIVDLALARAMVLGDMLHRYREALAVLQDARGRYRDRACPNMPRVYAREAEVLANLGDEQAIVRLIVEFRKSPFYDPEAFRYSGGQGRDVPLQVTRPQARGDDSLTIMTMEMYRKRARTAPGRLFPDFQLVDREGRPVRLADYRGRIVLIDFWLPDALVWRRELPNLQYVHRRLRAQGFEIIGICQSRDAAAVDGFLRGARLPWPVVMGDYALAGKLGLFGELGSYLLDRNGVVLARNLAGADLLAVVEQALGLR